MQTKRSRALERTIFAAALALGLLACAGNTRVVDHSFGFDVAADSPGVQLLDFRYGDSQFPGAHNPERLRKEGTAPSSANTSGPMRIGTFLYVKWRIVISGQEFEETVDLRRRLPDDITGHKIYFMIRGPQLYVYLIPPESTESTNRSSAPPSVVPRRYRNANARMIYPDQPKS